MVLTLYGKGAIVGMNGRIGLPVEAAHLNPMVVWAGGHGHGSNDSEQPGIDLRCHEFRVFNAYAKKISVQALHCT